MPRIGLWDRYGGSMPSGWTRWILEKFEFPFTIVYPQSLDAGNLSQKFDVLIFVDEGIPESDRRTGTQPDPQGIPAQYRDRLGNVSVATTVPQLKRFLEDGGAILAIGSSTNMGQHAALPIENALAELPRTKFYVPGSILRARVDNTHPLAFGLDQQVDLFFENSPSFRLLPGSDKVMKAVAWYDSPAPLRSGWAWGQNQLQGTAAIVDATVGKGKLLLYGPEILFRAQPHGTFKFLFNGIYYGSLYNIK
jgi:hypothetical protein